MNLTNKIENVTVGTVTNILLDTCQIELGDVVVNNIQYPVTVCDLYIPDMGFPAIGDRVAVTAYGCWVPEATLIKVVDAVAAMMAKLGDLPPKIQRNMLNLVLRNHMGWVAGQRAKGN
ncbi:hypothetical protein UFOVP184_27 [uncultured Caudovirales phage]|uniref:Uncharacterized protein n=1 Tax=uncultured Caudovirales phage TaxID=2100421 RepID=A0A6J7WJX7_9CAUD|nr:hypothetical protein UFOVP184_27 [uncultured Caudovirales phage]